MKAIKEHQTKSILQRFLNDLISLILLNQMTKLQERRRIRRLFVMKIYSHEILYRIAEAPNDLILSIAF